MILYERVLSRGDMNLGGVIEINRLACRMFDFENSSGSDWLGEGRAGDSSEHRISRFETRSSWHLLCTEMIPDVGAFRL